MYCLRGKSIKHSSLVKVDADHIGHSDRSGDERFSSQYFKLWSNKEYFIDFSCFANSRPNIQQKDTSVINWLSN